ncbi:MAG: hypothetical protein ACI4VL_02390 [Bacilli bacterium]
MNEQEMIQRQKIEKREKVDRVIAYILIVILLGAIAFVLYAKFIMKSNDNTTKPEEYTPNYITLTDISSSLNSSILANRYLNDGVTFSSSISNNALVVTYVKDTTNLNLNIPLVNNELEVVIDSSNSEIITDIYKEISTIICTFYGNDETSCRTTIDTVNADNPVDGIRFVNSDDTNTVYIDIMKRIPVQSTTNSNTESELLYTEVTTVDLSLTNYKLNISNTEISNINITTSDTDIKFSGNINGTSGEEGLSVVVKLFDEMANTLGENKYEYTLENPLNGEGTFEVSFILSDTLKLENIKKYSIDVVR